jgi:putative heme-binding domain-containing protein
VLSAIEGGVISVNELSAAARQQLLHSGSRSMMVRAQRLIESTGGGAVEKQRLVERYLADFAVGETADEGSEGEPHDGATLFAKHCGACHTPDDQGRTIGPSLANLTDRRDRSIVESVLDPNRAVEPRFQSYLIRTEDDELLVGGIENELAETITLARADGTRILVDRRRIAEMKNSGLSLMPEGFETLLTPQQLRAVVRHIQNW